MIKFDLLYKCILITPAEQFERCNKIQPYSYSEMNIFFMLLIEGILKTLHVHYAGMKDCAHIHTNILQF